MVLHCARDMGYRGATLNILRLMCWDAEWNEPTVTVSQAHIAEETGHDIRTVRYAISDLKKSGILIPIANPRGGRYRNRATTFKLWYKKPIGGSDAPDYGNTAQLRASGPSIEGEGSVNRGRETPTSIYSINSIGEGTEGDPSRVEEDKPHETIQKRYSKRLTELLVGRSYGEAMSLLKAEVNKEEHASGASA